MADGFIKCIQPRKRRGVYIWNTIFNHTLLSWATSFIELDLLVITKLKHSLHSKKLIYKYLHPLKSYYSFSFGILQ